MPLISDNLQETLDNYHFRLKIVKDCIINKRVYSILDHISEHIKNSGISKKLLEYICKTLQGAVEFFQ